MKMMLKTLILLSFTLLVQAKIIHVTQMQESISSALHAASAGDTILLAHGTYTQPALIKIDKSVLIASSFIFSGDQEDIEKTKISAADDDRMV